MSHVSSVEVRVSTTDAEIQASLENLIDPGSIKAGRYIGDVFVPETTVSAETVEDMRRIPKRIYSYPNPA